MRYVKPIEHSLGVGIRRRRSENYRYLRAVDEGPLVALYIYEQGKKKPARLAMTTTIAHKIGMSLVRRAEEAIADPGTIVVLVINGTEIDLRPEEARQKGGGLLRRADFADDNQIEHGMRAYQ